MPTLDPAEPSLSQVLDDQGDLDHSFSHLFHDGETEEGYFRSEWERSHNVARYSDGVDIKCSEISRKLAQNGIEQSPAPKVTLQALCSHDNRCGCKSQPIFFAGGRIGDMGKRTFTRCGSCTDICLSDWIVKNCAVALHGTEVHPEDTVVDFLRACGGLEKLSTGARLTFTLATHWGREPTRKRCNHRCPPRGYRKRDTTTQVSNSHSCPGSGFAYCVGDAKLENDRVGDVSKPVSGKAMCRGLRYVSAFLKLDRVHPGHHLVVFSCQILTTNCEEVSVTRSREMIACNERKQAFNFAGGTRVNPAVPWDYTPLRALVSLHGAEAGRVPSSHLCDFAILQNLNHSGSVSLRKGSPHVNSRAAGYLLGVEDLGANPTNISAYSMSLDQTYPKHGEETGKMNYDTLFNPGATILPQCRAVTRLFSGSHDAVGGCGPGGMSRDALQAGSRDLGGWQAIHRSSE
ncbi:hypothetical protein B0H10DRAFT_2197132 [Mycena sp. CBHHK59/15]|nr:hypothetical protein B0H10DRAFT_2197132 [Mycena sp. CBHHK59/15]